MNKDQQIVFHIGLKDKKKSLDCTVKGLKRIKEQQVKGKKKELKLKFIPL